MSEVFEGYERQYCELSANLSKKCTAASLLDGGNRKSHMIFISCSKFIQHADELSYCSLFNYARIGNILIL